MPVPPPLRPGTVLVGRFQVGHQIGGGANSRVYRARDGSNGQLVALKIEQVPDVARELLKAEAEVLEALCGSVGIPRMVAFAEAEESAGGSVLAMELLGEDLRAITLRAKRFSARATAFLGIQMLAALKGVHERGLVHRDVKPGNFAFGRKPEERLKIYLIDFGLVRRHLEEDGVPRRARSETMFRGTTHYASMAAMLCKDLGRADDLWSLTFSLLEMCAGALPWDKFYRRAMPREQKVKAKRRVLEEKRRLVAAVAHADPQAIEVLRPYARFLSYVPTQLREFMRELLPLRYESHPNYARLFSLLRSVGQDAECRAAAEHELHVARQRIAARAAAVGEVQKQPTKRDDPAQHATCTGRDEVEKVEGQEELTAGSELAYSPGAGDNSTGSRSHSASPVRKGAPTQKQYSQAGACSRHHSKHGCNSGGTGDCEQVMQVQADFQRQVPTITVGLSIQGTSAGEGDAVAGEEQAHHESAKLAQVGPEMRGDMVAPVAEVDKEDPLAGKAQPDVEHTKPAHVAPEEDEARIAPVARAGESLQPVVQQAATVVGPEIGSITDVIEQATVPTTATVELAREQSKDTDCPKRTHSESLDTAKKQADTMKKSDAEPSHETSGKCGDEEKVGDRESKKSQAPISVAFAHNGPAPDVEIAPTEACRDIPEGRASVNASGSTGSGSSGSRQQCDASVDEQVQCGSKAVSAAATTQPHGSQCDFQQVGPQVESDHISSQAQGRRKRRERAEEVEGSERRRKQKRAKIESSDESSKDDIHGGEATQKSEAELEAQIKHGDASTGVADAQGPYELISDRAASLVGFTSWCGKRCGESLRLVRAKSLRLVRAHLIWQDEEPSCKVQQEFHRVGVNHNGNVMVCTVLAFMGSEPPHLTLPRGCISGSSDTD